MKIKQLSAIDQKVVRVCKEAGISYFIISKKENLLGAVITKSDAEVISQRLYADVYSYYDFEDS